MIANAAFLAGVDQAHARLFQRPHEERLGRPVKFVMAGLEFPDRAARHAGLASQLFLVPVEQAAGGAALRWLEMGQRYRTLAVSTLLDEINQNS